MACFCGHVDVVRLLIDHGADPDATAHDGNTLLDCVSLSDSG